MGFSGLLRAVGDARRAMNVTLLGGVVTAVVDPILIFWMGLGVDGAAWGVNASRLVFAIVGYRGAVGIHGMVARPTLASMRAEARAIWGLAAPAILTNIATPLSLAVVARIISDLGTWAIAANTVNQRIEPVAFGALFALSGAVGPILAQNWGARMYHRMRSGLRDAFLFAAGYVALTWSVLVLARHQIVTLFNLTGAAAEGVIAFCWISGPLWFFMGMLFSANAAFNNLGFPLYATAFNWGRAIVGTAGGAWLGAAIGGYAGALIGITLGSAVFGVAAAVVALGCIGTLERRERAAGATVPSIAEARRPA
jgi:Na+-driven multidrug efflux pump